MRLARYFLFFTLFCLSASASATTIQWLVKPEYDSVKFYSESVFKCVKKGKIQLIDDKGRCLLPTPADFITEYSDGFALVCVKSGSNMKICGILEEDGLVYHAVQGNYYCTFYSPCSEGMIAVKDSRGKEGYLYATGELAISCQFGLATPFKQGLAVVESIENKGGKKGTYYYIDYIGEQVDIVPSLPFKTFTTALNFNEQGEALVAHYEHVYIINSEGRVVRDFDGTNYTIPYREDGYVYDENVDYAPVQSNPKFFPDSRFVTFNENGKVGIERNGFPIAYAQFDEIHDISSNFAIVEYKGHEGVLKFVNGDFSASLSDTEFAVMKEEPMPEVVCSLSCPVYGTDDMHVEFDKGDGEYKTIALNNNQYVFQPYFAASETNSKVRLKVKHDDLMLWEHEIEMRRSFVQIELGKLYCTNEFADENDMQRVKISVHNNSSTSVSVKPNFHVIMSEDSGNSIVSRSSSEVTLGPNDRKEFVVVFKVVKDETIKVDFSLNCNNKLLGNKSLEVKLVSYY